MARPIEKFQCKGCQTRPPTPRIETSQSMSPVIKELKENLRSPPTIVEPPTKTSTDGAPKRVVSPTPSDASNASNAFYVCNECDGIKLVGYKPSRRSNHDPQLFTYPEEEEPDYYHFSRKHPSEVQQSLATNPKLSPNRPQPPTNLPIQPSGTPSPTTKLPLAKDPRSYPSPKSPAQLDPLIQHPKNIPTPPPLPPINFKNTGAESNSRHSSPSIPSPPLLPPLDFNTAGSKAQDRRNFSPSIHKPTAFSPVQPKTTSKINRSPVDRSPGKYPPIGDIFPPPPSTLPTHAPSRDKGRVSFVDPGNEPESSNSSSSNQKRNSKLETLF
ncbi:Hypothetical predicted protein [Paramuricea clavata]|uniref:Uncharacterized protein n=1 Tax=Paramuricea clavata TaxID=317549 RepID=A0A6S7J0W0_PARCT|nr:Hypothetical predicted protein [Paramuricea clavata]